MSKRRNLTSPHVTDDKKTAPHDEGQNGNLTCTHVKPTKSARISAHRLRWTWGFTGTTSRRPDGERRMRGWTGNIYNWHGAKVILNVKTMEIYMKSRPYKDTKRMIYANWDKADRYARAFSEWARIAIRPIHSEHPGDLQSAHLVINRKAINRELLPGTAKSPERRRFVGADEPYLSAKRVGAVEDGSHPGKVELKGRESAEGGLGLDWLLLEHPKAHDTLDARLEKMVIVLESLTDAVQAIRIRMDMEVKKP